MSTQSALREEPGEAPVEPEGGGAPSIFEIAGPTIAGNVLQTSVGFVDMVIVGSLGASAVAAVTTGNRLFFVSQAVLMGITAGTTALVARAWGGNDRAEAELVTRASVWACALLGIGVGLLGVIFAHPLGRAFGLDGETAELAAIFIRWLFVFNFAFGIHTAIGAALRAAGDAVTPVWLGVVANLLNVALVWTLVHGHFGFPALGVQGAAIASGLSFSTAAVVGVALWLGKRLRLGWGAGKSIERARVARLVHVGYPAALEQLVIQSGFIAFLWIVGRYSTEAFAAYGIGVQILGFSFVIGFGFSIAASTLVGQQLGAARADLAERSGWRAMRLALVAMTVLGVLIIAGAEQIARFTIDDAEVVRLTVAFIYILGACQPLMAIEFTLSGALRGAGDTRFPLATVLVGFFGVRIPLAALCAWRGLSVEWVYAALIADYIVKGSMLAWRFRGGAWKHLAV